MLTSSSLEGSEEAVVDFEAVKNDDAAPPQQQQDEMHRDDDQNIEEDQVDVEDAARNAMDRLAELEAQLEVQHDVVEENNEEEEEEYIPLPLPTFNLSFHSEFDVYALAEMLEEKESKTSNSSFNDFWSTARALRDEFADSYGGEDTARALLDLGISTFGWDNTKTFTPTTSNLPTDLKYTACRILNAKEEKRPFRFTFGGYSVTAGRGNYFNQSFPFVMQNKLSEPFSLLGVPLDVQNAAIGGCPSFPYGWCMEQFWGTDTDVVSWDFAMNEAGGDPLGLEAYVRHTLQLPRRPKLIVKDTFMADQRRSVLQYYLQQGFLKDPVVIHTEPATEPFLERVDRDLPVGFQEWRKFGAPRGAPGQALHHPAVKEHEFIAWLLTMHFLSALELAAASLQNPKFNLKCHENIEIKENSTLPKPLAVLGNKTNDPPWTSMLFGERDTKNSWLMKPVHCRTTFQPTLPGGDLTKIAVAGSTGVELDIMLPKSKMFYNRGWVLDMSESEKNAKRTLSIYEGLGFQDSKQAFYGIVMSGSLRLLLPYETKAGGTLPKAGAKAADWFRSVVVCKVNEKREVDACDVSRDMGFEIGGVNATKSALAMDASGTLYLGKKICVFLPVPAGAVLTTPSQIREREAKRKSLVNGVVFPDADKKWENRVGLEVGVSVLNHLAVKVDQACSVSHVIWEQQR